MRTVFIGLGSNQGDRKRLLLEAVERLAAAGLAPALRSSLYRTDPVEVLDQDEFLNQVIGFETVLSAADVLAACLSAERVMGRLRTRDKGPRTIDLDLLLDGNRVVTEGGLQVPHPRLHLRRFVLVPLAEIAPRAFHPILEMTAEELLAICPDRSRIERDDS